MINKDAILVFVSLCLIATSIIWSIQSGQLERINKAQQEQIVNLETELELVKEKCYE